MYATGMEQCLPEVVKRVAGAKARREPVGEACDPVWIHDLRWQFSAPERGAAPGQGVGPEASAAAWRWTKSPCNPVARREVVGRRRRLDGDGPGGGHGIIPMVQIGRCNRNLAPAPTGEVGKTLPGGGNPRPSGSLQV